MNPLARCGHCQHPFEVEAKFTGGLVPCPNCGKVVDVPGLRDPIWLALRIGAVVAAVGVGVLVGSWRGVETGAVVTAGVLFVLWLASRVL